MATKTVRKPRITMNETNRAQQPDISELLKIVAEQQGQIATLQKGQLEIVEVVRKLAGEIMRLERHGGLNVSNILLPAMTDWQKFQENK